MTGMDKKSRAKKVNVMTFLRVSVLVAKNSSFFPVSSCLIVPNEFPRCVCLLSFILTFSLS